jgi:signal transduction histidine kinase
VEQNHSKLLQKSRKSIGPERTHCFTNPLARPSPSFATRPCWQSRSLRYILPSMARSPDRSPTKVLFLGLIITIAAVIAYSWYITLQFSHLRELQNNLVEHNRRDSLQLLRVQNDLNSLGLAMRDMLDNDEPYPITAWSAQFQRIHGDLDAALQTEQQLSAARRTPEQTQYLQESLAQFWDAADRTFALAQAGKDKDAREQIRLSLQERQATLSTAVSRLLVQNNESEQEAAAQVARIYDRVQRQVYLFLTAILAAILLTSLYIIRSNRRLFAQLAALSQQRRELAQKLISSQESMLRSISRELHDEFGQILTAIGSMLTRAQKHIPVNSPLHDDLREVRDIAQTTLNNLRTLSQALHPVMLDETGLESTMDWYIPTVEKQTGIDITYQKSGIPFSLDGAAAIHIYRVLQEALNNVARHSGARTAQVRLRFSAAGLELEVEDHGKGVVAPAARSGIGLVAMRERAELLRGSIEFTQPAEGGTLVRMKVPREGNEANVG